jgi:hypothetical protein
MTEWALRPSWKHEVMGSKHAFVSGSWAIFTIKKNNVAIIHILHILNTFGFSVTFEHKKIKTESICRDIFYP